MSLTTTPASLTVGNGSAPTAIGIAAPADSAFPVAKLKIVVTALPSDGVVDLADGITPVLPGELLTVSELTGLTFAGAANAAGQSSQFTYQVSDPNAATATGSATLAVVANANSPQTTPASLTVAANGAATAINIAAPTDPNFSAASLTVTVLGLPADGRVVMADGVTPVTAGETLSVSQLTGLKFAPTAGAVAESGLFSFRVGDPAGASSLGSATLSIAASGNVLTVGRGKQFATIAAAVAASQNGDTIQVQAGTYVNDFATITTNITLEGVGGMVNMVCTTPIPNGKAILVTDADVTINNFSFSGAQVADANGAGIRYELGNLVLNNDAFFGNQDGLLSAANPTGTITINGSEFANNGIGDGRTHNLYVGAIATLTIDDSYFHDANVGHEIKSRAFNTTIRNSRIDDGPSGTASYSIDLPNGGNALIQNNVIEQGPLSQNSIIITSGEEGGVYASSSLVVSGNTILNDLSGSPLAVKNATTATAQITGNQFFGLTAGQIASGPSTQSGNSFLASEPALDTSHPWSPEVTNLDHDAVNNYDFNGDGTSDVLLKDTGGTVVTWTVKNAGFAGGSLIGTVPSGWSVVGTGDFNGDGTSDVLLEDTGGTVVTWTVKNAGFAGGSYIGTAPPGWSVIGVGDFNGDGTSDVLLKDTGGTVVTWTVNNGGFVEGSLIGTAPPGWSVVGIGDFNGDGTSDVLLEDTGGTVVTWTVKNAGFAGGSYIGTAPPGWSVLGTGDFNGDGTSDVLLEDTGGNIVTWTVKNAAFSGGSLIGTVPSGWSVVGIGDFNGDGTSDVLLEDTGGTVVTWTVKNAGFAGGSYIGTAPPGWSIAPSIGAVGGQAPPGASAPSGGFTFNDLTLPGATTLGADATGATGPPAAAGQTAAATADVAALAFAGLDPVSHLLTG